MKKTWPEYREELCSLEQPRQKPNFIAQLAVNSLKTVGEEFWLGLNDEDELLLLTWFARPRGERRWRLEKSGPSGKLIHVQGSSRMHARNDSNLNKLAPLPRTYGHVMTSLPRKGEDTWPSLTLNRMVISKIWANDPGVIGPQIMNVAWALADKDASELKRILAMFPGGPIMARRLRLGPRVLAEIARAPGALAGLF